MTQTITELLQVMAEVFPGVTVWDRQTRTLVEVKQLTQGVGRHTPPQEAR